MNEISVHPKETNGSASMIEIISRAARDESVNIDKLERLMAMHERMQAKQAESAYNASLAEMQDELPSIGERGSAAGRYTYALWEDINTAVKPILKKHGFALSFSTDCSDGVAVTGVLSHKAGHKEETTIKLAPDASGNKNGVQAVASSVSYGKRYTAGALLNLTSHGEDDDAYSAAKPVPEYESPEYADWCAKVDECDTAPEFAAVWKEMTPSVRRVMEPYIKAAKEEKVKS